MFKCEKCSYRCKKEITLNKHMNTKHGDKNSDIVILQLETTLTPTKPAKNNKFFCDECDYGCSNKKILKKHKGKDHNHQDLSTAVTIENDTKLSYVQECEMCNKKFKTKTDLENHIYQVHSCYCTEENTCEGCMDEWIASGRSPEDYPSS